MKRYTLSFWLCLVALAAIAVSGYARPLPQQVFRDTILNPLLPAPQPTTVDQITHNVGNIVTTIDNYGYIGGYDYYNQPSGEWPRNSGHNYLAEIRYWMGAVTASGDTVVANTYDDFEALPDSQMIDNPYKIMLSTDSTRYRTYDISDTVGIGSGNPAFGWRVWNPQTDLWEYNKTYNTLSTNFELSGPTSLQDSHYRFGDHALGTPALGLEITQTVYSWNYCYNEDFMFVVLEITNKSTEDYTEFAFGLYTDIDVGGRDGTGENGRLADLVAFDSTENLAWIYDNIGIDPGWGPTVRTGIMGTKYLETPGGVGMTAFRTDDWAFLPSDDAGMYAMINSTQFDASLPPTDQFYVQCSRGITLNAGATVRVVFALIAGADEADFRANAQLAQQLYDSYFVGPEPPTTPVLSARANDGSVYLHWSDTSEAAVDPMSGLQDFAGYKLYRSDNQGKTWGIVNYQTGNNCLDLDYQTLALYTVNNPGDPIPHSFVDTGLYNGVDYWYCLAAFDLGDTVVGVDPLQSGFGVAGQTPNVVSVTPRPNPSGYFSAAGTIIHEYTGNDQASPGTVTPEIFDYDALTGQEYAVVFEDRPEATYWHLLDLTNNDTVLADQTRMTGDPDEFEIAGGIRVYVTNGDFLAQSHDQTSFATAADTTLIVATWYGASLPALTGNDNNAYGDQHFRSNYELRYTGDSTRATEVRDGFWGSDYIYWVPFEVWNTSTNQRVSLAVYDFLGDDIWDSYDLLAIVNYPYDSINSVTSQAFPEYYSWMWGFDETVYNPSVGDVFTIDGAPLNSPDDRFTFKIDGIDAKAAAGELDQIKVVPNPYFGRYNSRVETGDGEAIIEFQNIPNQCTIRIYTLSGDLVRTIENSDGDGSVRWNLQSSSQQQVASGIYLYHVESSYGEHLGRFAVIK